MATKNTTDQFANLAIISVTESAANTLTYKKLETGISLSEKVAWIISRVEFSSGELSPTIFNGSADELRIALTVSNSMATLVGTDPMVLDFLKITRYDYGTAATAVMSIQPIIKDYTNLPGGGIIVPPQPLYLAAAGVGLTAAVTVVCRIYYTLLPLAVDQYWELIEARRVLAS